jgi:hypothetical protein
MRCVARWLIVLALLVLGPAVSLAQQATETSLAMSPSPVNVDERVTFVAAVTSATGIPAGEVDFFAAGQLLATASLSAGQAEVSHIFLTGGSMTIRAAYRGSGEFLASQAERQLEVIRINTSTYLMTSGSPSLAGDPVSFRASVISNDGGPPPDGRVSFSVDSVEREIVDLANGLATMTVDDLTPGIHQISASFSGTPRHDVSAGDLTQTVDPIVVVPQVTAASTPNPSIVGEAVTVSATVTAPEVPGPLQGDVDFVIGGVTRSAPIVGGRATLTLGSLAAGDHTIDVVTRDVTSPGSPSYGFAPGRARIVHRVLDVVKVKTVTTVGSSPNPSEIGDTVVFTAAVRTIDGDPVDGTVMLSIDGSLYPLILSDGVATISTATLLPGEHAVTARFSETAELEGSSAQSTHVVGVAEGVGTRVVLSLTPSPSEIRQPVLMAAEVIADAGVASGAVRFLVDGVERGRVALASGRAGLEVPDMAAGEHLVTAIFVPAPPFAASIDQTTHGVVRLPSSTHLSASSETVTFGQPVHVTATVTGIDPLGNAPGGSVVFSIDGQAVRTQQLKNGSAVASFDLAIGEHVIEAAYDGDEIFEGSSQQINATVIPNSFPTITRLTSSPNPSDPGQPVTFDVSVTSPTTTFILTGTVLLVIDDATHVLTLVDGTARHVTASLAIGSHRAAAYYGGETDFAPSEDETVHEVSERTRVGTLLTVASAPNPSVFGDPATFRVTLHDDTGNPIDGVVALTIGADRRSLEVTDGSGAVSVSTLAPGEHAVSASFEGTDTFLPGRAEAVHRVDAATATTLTAAPSPSVEGGTVVFTATVSSAATEPTGLVTFRVNGVNAFVAPLVGGIASYSTADLPVGTHQVTADYGGDGTSLPSSASLAHVVTYLVRATRVDLVSSLNPSEFGDEVTFRATVSADTGHPQGEVSFTIGGVWRGTVALAGGTAAVAVDGLAIGEHVAIATFLGSNRYRPGESDPLVQLVAIPADSIALAQAQAVLTRLAAQASGQAISGAIDDAVADGLSEAGNVVAMTAGGVRLSFGAERAARSETAGSALDGLVPGSGTLAKRARVAANAMLGYGEPPILPERAPGFDEDRWRVWSDLRATALRSGLSSGGIDGDQVNLMAGIGYRLRPDLVVGVLAGYEAFDYVSERIRGRLDGAGWTVGSYLGWRMTPAMRFDAGLAHSWLGYDAAAGTAAGAFDGRRVLAQAGLTGSLALAGIQIEPSARFFALWEDQDAYLDSRGILHGARGFATARASAGLKASYPFDMAGGTLTPYVGIYADYRFSENDAGTILAAEGIVRDGLSARLSAGASLRFAGGAQVTLGGELGGLGNGAALSTSFRGRLSIPLRADR